MLSKACQYALRSVLYINEQQRRRKDRSFVRLKDLARAMKIPPHFGSKVLQQLTRTKILMSSRGSDGGFKFRTSPNRVTVMDVIESFSAEGFEKNCFLGAGECDSLKPCPAHEKWLPAREKLMEVMHSSIGSMTEELLLGKTFLMEDS